MGTIVARKRKDGSTGYTAQVIKKKDGKVVWREDVVEGLENAPRAFMGLLEGRNFGKLVVKVAD